jgi:hypothetical protein
MQTQAGYNSDHYVRFHVDVHVCVFVHIAVHSTASKTLMRPQSDSTTILSVIKRRSQRKIPHSSPDPDSFKPKEKNFLLASVPVPEVFPISNQGMARDASSP